MRKPFLFAAVVALFWSSCAENTSHQQEATTDTIPKVEETTQKNFFPIPSPEDLFAFIQDNGFKYQPALMNSPEKASLYKEPTTEAVNFGIYAADMAYASNFNDKQNAIERFQVLRTMATDLGLDAAMDEAMMKEVESNLDNPDSLVKVSKKFYFRTLLEMEANGRGAMLGAIATGGWIESMYLVTSSTEKFDKNSPVTQRIADQKLIYDNLIEYLSNHKDESSIAQLIEKLSPLGEIFGNIMNPGDATTVKKESGKLVIGGGAEVQLSEEKYTALKSEIKKIREAFVAAQG